MTSDDRLMTELDEANPVSRTERPGPRERAEAERLLHRVLSTPPGSRRPRSVLALAASAVVVVAVVAAALTIHRSGSGHAAPGGSRGTQIALQAQPTPQNPIITRAAMSREIEILRGRLGGVLHGLHVKAAGVNQVLVTASSVSPATRARALRLATQPAHLYFYDWEANALTPNGKTVASQLSSQDPPAILISQGTTVAATGDPYAGSTGLYQAVKLAAGQPKAFSAENARLGPQYYLFGAPGSAACAAAARERGTVPATGQHCLLAGPDNELYSTPHATAIKNLAAQLPTGVSASEGQVLVVQQGTAVLEAPNPTAGQQPPSIWSPSAQFFVLRDNVALRGSDITNPYQSTDTTGAPDVSFGFSSRGKTAFESVTTQIARRGQDVSTLEQTLNQHFAIALDNQLLTVASIDFRVYPDGITGSSGADIAGGFTATSASDLAKELRLGALPFPLRLLH